MNPVMYIFLNSGLGMSTGKAAAQAAHASPFAERLSRPDFIKAWYLGGHHTKLIMDGRDSTSMWWIKHYIEERGFKTKVIVDEGHTEGTWMVPTALGVEIVDKDDDHTAATFSSFRLLRDPRDINIFRSGPVEGACYVDERGRHYPMAQRPLPPAKDTPSDYFTPDAHKRPQPDRLSEPRTGWRRFF